MRGQSGQRREVGSGAGRLVGLAGVDSRSQSGHRRGGRGWAARPSRAFRSQFSSRLSLSCRGVGSVSRCPGVPVSRGSAVPAGSAGGGGLAVQGCSGAAVRESWQPEPEPEPEPEPQPQPQRWRRCVAAVRGGALRGARDCGGGGRFVWARGIGVSILRDQGLDMLGCPIPLGDSGLSAMWCALPRRSPVGAA